MKIYSVKFKEKVCHKYIGSRFNDELKMWENDVPCVEWNTRFEFSTLKEAKRLIRENREKYAGSSITKVWANGDWENLGEIKITGSNKTFVANTKQRKITTDSFFSCMILLANTCD